MTEKIEYLAQQVAEAKAEGARRAGQAAVPTWKTMSDAEREKYRAIAATLLKCVTYSGRLP